MVTATIDGITIKSTPTVDRRLPDGTPTFTPCIYMFTDARPWSGYGNVTRAEAEPVKASPEYAEFLAAAHAECRSREAEAQARRDKEAEHVARLSARRAEAEAQGKRVFVRFGAIPPSGRSYNHRDSCAEPGVSAYHAWLLPGKQLVVDLASMDAVSSLFIIRGSRPLYLVTGDVVGTGADGEPCLTNAKGRKYTPASIEVV